MPEEDLRHYHNKTRPDPLDEKLHLLGSLLIWSTTQGHELTQRPEFQRAFVVFSVRFVLEPRPEQELADRLVILPVRMLTSAVSRLTKRTNHLRGSHS